MIDFKVQNSNGVALLTLTTLQEISDFFNDKKIVNINEPASLIMYLTQNHYRHTHDDLLYYLHNMSINNKSGIVTICYDPVEG